MWIYKRRRIYLQIFVFLALPGCEILAQEEKLRKNKFPNSKSWIKSTFLQSKQNEGSHLKEQLILHLLHQLDVKVKCLGKIFEREKSGNHDFRDFRDVWISNMCWKLIDLMTLLYTKPATSWRLAILDFSRNSYFSISRPPLETYFFATFFLAPVFRKPEELGTWKFAGISFFAYRITYA